MTQNSISRFSKKSLEEFSLSPSTNQFLQIVGLPTWTSPRIYFGDFDGLSLPRLKDWLQIEGFTPASTDSNYLVLGSNEDQDPICINEIDEAIYVLDIDQNFEAKFMNSSVLQLAAILQSHIDMVEEALQSSIGEVIPENRIPLEIIQMFEKEIRELDPVALSNGSFWAKKIAEYKQGLKTYISAGKHHLESFGEISDYYESVRLKSVIFHADSKAVRILAEFFTSCADGMEKFEKQGDWDHQHLRDYWKEWYSSKYPDVIVCREPIEKY